jgi:hypothetical protein
MAKGQARKPKEKKKPKADKNKKKKGGTLASGTAGAASGTNPFAKKTA